MRGGVASTPRFIPVHCIANMIEIPRCKSLLAMHMLTGTDVTTKLGTTASALKVKPELYLADFRNDSWSNNLFPY